MHKRTVTHSIGHAVAAAVMGVSFQAESALILDTGVVATFGSATAGTHGNDLPGHPNELYYGQLQAEQDGFVDFFYIGNEAGYVNSLVLNGVSAHSSNGLADHFNAPYPLIGSIAVTAGSFLDFGFCTSGGDSLRVYGKCAHNDDAGSLTSQFHYQGSGYRSIGFRSVDLFSPTSSSWNFGTNGPSDLWMVFWDDSGAKNDDNHDDYVAVTRFRPVSVPEPSTALLFGAGLLGLGLAARRRGAV